MTTLDVNHGTATAYRAGCCCDDCAEANRDYQREWRRQQRKGDATTLRPFEPRPFWFSFASRRPEYADRPLDQWVDMFFPTRGQPNREAREICAECPARDACADHGLAEKFGVWGGTSEREREAS